MVGFYKIDLIVVGMMMPEAERLSGFHQHGLYLTVNVLASSMEKAIAKADRLLGHYKAIAAEFGPVDKGERIVTLIEEYE